MSLTVFVLTVAVTGRPAAESMVAAMPVTMTCKVSAQESVALRVTSRET